MMGSLRATDQSHEWLHHDFRPNDANLDAQDNLICSECYVANPPPDDVESIFAQVIAHMTTKLSARMHAPSRYSLAA